MRHREAGHDKQHVSQGLTGAFGDLEAARLTPQHRGQKQPGQKQQVIQPNPDVPEAFMKILPGHPRGAGFAQIEDLPATGRREHSRFDLAPVCDS